MKEPIRSVILKHRERLSVLEALEKSAKILKLLRTLPEYQKAKVIHSYIASKSNEVDTKRSIDMMLKEGKRVVVPITDPKNRILHHSEIFDLNGLRIGTFGILEPEEIKPIDPKEIELVIVPSIALDRKGNRVGFGGGYYDKFLKQVLCPKIALAYDFQIVRDIVPGQHDVGVDAIITETEVIRCK